MEPHMIKARLIERKTGPAKIARELKVSTAMVSMVMYGRCRSKRVEDAIARKTRIPVSVLFSHRRELEQAA